MFQMDTLSWEEPLTQRMKVERNLNFSTISNEEDEFGFSRKKTARDPMSHRIIEKRRRDRMNNCLADLSRLVPTNYLKKGRGRIEKTEIIEMAIKHLKHLQAHPCKDPANCEVAKTTEQDHKRQYRLGFTECMSETVRYLVESEGMFSRDGICVRLMNHLQKHHEKLAGGLCYTQALGMMVSDDSKAVIQMDVDGHSNSCFPPDGCSNGGLPPENGHITSFPYENRCSEVPDLKQEVETNGHPQPQQATTVVKVTSQLREMLQNPGVPKDSSRSVHNTSANNNPGRAPSPVSMPVLVVVPPINQNETPKTEESCYKFKNNIKHRFNADLRHHTSSPTDSHLSDRMSLPDEDHNNNKIHVAEPYPIRPCPQLPEDRLLSNGLCNSNSHTGHAFSPYPTSHPAAELIVKIPERTAQPDGVPLSSAYSTHQWDSHAETASSCGSNSSPPPNTVRSNASSSGYSTNGENNSVPTLLKSTNGAHSPALSPYSRTPDRLSNRSPSPLQAGIPIFALHPKGSYYIPLTIDSSILIPYLVGMEDLAPVLHPISICVNLSTHSVKVEKLNGSTTLQYRPQSSFLMDKFQDRYVYPEKPMFYATSPTRNGCT